MANKPIERAHIFSNFAKKQVTVGDGFAFRTDADLERAYRFWLARGAPGHVSLRIDNLANDNTQVVMMADGKEVAHD